MDKHGGKPVILIFANLKRSIYKGTVSHLYGGRTEGEDLIARPLGVAVHVDEDVDAVLRWKSQRIKIHRLAYRFYIDFSIHTG